MTGNRVNSRERRVKSEEERASSPKPYALSSMPPEFLAIGHFTHDIAQCGRILGGAAAYSSIAARGLGLRASVVSAVGEDFLYYEKLDGISLALVGATHASPLQDSLATTFANVYDESALVGATHASPLQHSSTTTFANIYDDEGRRRQILESVSAPIHPEHIPAEWLDADIVYLCPVADEVDPSIAHMFPNSLIGVSPQGWMRQWDDRGQVSPREWKDAPNVLPHVDVLVMSEEDISPFPEVIHEYIALAETVVLTRGEKGSTLFHDGQSIDFPAFPTYTVDPTGAGDVFAAAFLSTFHQTRDLYEASIFANCTASFVVERQGTEGIPDLDRVRARMMSHQSR
jgi:1D-myo-inositol 3-kinase